MTVRVASPVGGRVVPLAEVPDPVFAQAMVGPGIAVDPERAPADAVSPVDGTVVTLHPHAFVVATDTGPAVLVHLGIDTVKLKGEGFTLHVVKGESVRAGQPVVGWDPGKIEAAGYSPVCPVIALDAQPDELGEQRASGAVEAGAPLFTWHR
ncbi:PTS sugar transporter subunit IIA [Gandjariella thermophila]|uniref:PTS glucose transporter subunit IIA n=1 Tax=Gandjariella thermophila TaxID=1931992 RepID=A0A4D4J2Z6_9PSEU|nr:PTS glucose transporter subunit IIA [Gandjariella thermophila]GDY28856.1 PTS glucose transporter subunit IIA [Gandjariella thermophila]